jgi:predicted  nucleic acid-binding Zn-ribbon protein
MKSLKIREDRGIDLSFKNLISIVVTASLAVYGYFQLESRLQKLETSRQIMESDLIKKSDQKNTDQEQFLLLEHLAKQVENLQSEQELQRNNNVNLKRAMKDIENLLQQLELLKDKVRDNGKHQ